MPKKASVECVIDIRFSGPGLSDDPLIGIDFMAPGSRIFIDEVAIDVTPPM
jgi:hypothetical protein